MNIHMQNDELECLLHTINKNSKWITDLNSCQIVNSKWIIDLRAKTIKSLENLGVNLQDLGVSNDFLDTTPKAHETKKKFDKVGFIKIRNVCISEINKFILVKKKKQ